MSQTKVNIQKAFEEITEYWKPYLAGTTNGQEIKLARVKGEFIWHQHDEADEMFFVIEGQLQLLMETSTVTLNPGEFYIVPRGRQHKPYAEDEVKIMLFEPAGTINTGEKKNHMTQDDLPGLDNQ